MSGGWYEDGSEEAEKILTARLEHGRVNDKIGKNMPRSSLFFANHRYYALAACVMTKALYCALFLIII